MHPMYRLHQHTTTHPRIGTPKGVFGPGLLDQVVRGGCIGDETPGESPQPFSVLEEFGEVDRGGSGVHVRGLAAGARSVGSSRRSVRSLAPGSREAPGGPPPTYAAGGFRGARAGRGAPQEGTRRGLRVRSPPPWPLRALVAPGGRPPRAAPRGARPRLPVQPDCSPPASAARPRAPLRRTPPAARLQAWPSPSPCRCS